MGSHGAVLSLRDPEGTLVQLLERAPGPAGAPERITEAV